MNIDSVSPASAPLCRYCGEPIGDAERTTRKFCDDHCRKAFARRKAELPRTADKAARLISALYAQAEHYPDLRADVENLLSQLAALISVPAAARASNDTCEYCREHNAIICYPCFIERAQPISVSLAGMASNEEPHSPPDIRPILR